MLHVRRLHDLAAYYVHIIYLSRGGTDLQRTVFT